MFSSRHAILTGGETLDEGGLASVGVDLGEELGGGGKVGGPAEPSGVASVHVHVYANGSELDESVVHASEVGRLRVGALRDAQVGDQVGKRVGLNDGHDLGVGVFLDSLDDLVNVVVLILVNTIVVDEEFTV